MTTIDSSLHRMSSLKSTWETISILEQELATAKRLLELKAEFGRLPQSDRRSVLMLMIERWFKEPILYEKGHLSKRMIDTLSTSAELQSVQPAGCTACAYHETEDCPKGEPSFGFPHECGVQDDVPF